MHGPPRAGHRDINCASFAWLNARSGTLTMTWFDSLGLAGVTGDSHSLIEMKTGAVANNLAFIEYDLAIINADHGPELVIDELLPVVFDIFVNRIQSPIGNDLLPLEHAENPCLFEWQLLLDAAVTDDDSSLLPAKDFPQFAAAKALFLNSAANSSPGDLMKLDDLPWLISDRITLLGVSQIQPLKSRDGMFRVLKTDPSLSSPFAQRRLQPGTRIKIRRASPRSKSQATVEEKPSPKFAHRVESVYCTEKASTSRDSCAARVLTADV
jgi:hypothetical protein